MDKKLESKLVKKFPSLYQDYNGDMRHTCMHWGFECGNGWFHIIYNLSQDITEIERKYKIKVIADQVKEKFGGLRFYYHINYNKPLKERNHWFQKLMYKKRLGKQYWAIINFKKKFWKTPEDKISCLVDEAEILSYKTCEKCSNPGSAKGGGWVTTLCDDCRNKK